MKLVDQYHVKQGEIRAQIEEGTYPPDRLFQYQELTYRICVLETMRDFCKSAPATTDLRTLSTHFKIVDAYIKFIMTERQLGCKTDEDGLKRRETAHLALEKVVQDYGRRFSGFKASAPDQYQKQVTDMINAVISVWLQYRTTYINL